MLAGPQAPALRADQGEEAPGAATVVPARRRQVPARQTMLVVLRLLKRRRGLRVGARFRPCQVQPGRRHIWRFLEPRRAGRGHGAGSLGVGRSPGTGIAAHGGLPAAAPAGAGSQDDGGSYRA